MFISPASKPPVKRTNTSLAPRYMRHGDFGHDDRVSQFHNLE